MPSTPTLPTWDFGYRPFWAALPSPEPSDVVGVIGTGRGMRAEALCRVLSGTDEKLMKSRIPSDRRPGEVFCVFFLVLRSGPFVRRLDLCMRAVPGKCSGIGVAGLQTFGPSTAPRSCPTFPLSLPSPSSSSSSSQIAFWLSLTPRLLSLRSTG
eukprot:RCo017685